MAYIYKISNTVNDNVYIGETVQSIEKRWWAHKNAAEDLTKNGHLQLAFRKYGVDKFQIEVIEECPNELRFEREKYWIAYYNSYYNGYNSTLGGEGGLQHDYDRIWQLWQEGLTIKLICEEVGCCSTTAQTALKQHGIERKDYINRVFAKEVEQYTPNGQLVATFSSANEAGRKMGLVNGSNILKCCRGEIKTSKGYIWKFIEDPTPIEELIVIKKKNTTGKPVLQYSLEGEFIQEYESCEQAGKAIGKSGSGINRCARQERDSAYGYRWKYKKSD